MSADNWGTCPKCKEKNDEANAKRISDAEEQYGKIPSDEYRELIKCAEKPIKLEETLREDYEMATDSDGLFWVNYSCRCDECGFEHKFHHSEQLVS
jgi:hypothetical protein